MTLWKYLSYFPKHLIWRLCYRLFALNIVHNMKNPYRLQKYTPKINITTSSPSYMILFTSSAKNNCITNMNSNQAQNVKISFLCSNQEQRVQTSILIKFAIVTISIVQMNSFNVLMLYFHDQVFTTNLGSTTKNNIEMIKQTRKSLDDMNHVYFNGTKVLYMYGYPFLFYEQYLHSSHDLYMVVGFALGMLFQH